MNTQKLPLIIGFNLIIVIADIVLLSNGITSLGNSVRLVILIASIVIFLVGNYFLLSSAFKAPVLKNKENANADDFEDALKGWKGMNTPYGAQIDMALKQLEQFRTRKEKLKALSDDNTFESAVDEVQTNMFRNFNRMINRLIIFDKNDKNDINRNGNYINGILQTNAQYLEVFRRFIDEIAMIGDNIDDSSASLSLHTITESLKEIRTNGIDDQD